VDEAGLAEQAEAMGMGPDALAAMLRQARARQPEPVEVMPANVEALRVFLAMGTQWRRAGMAGLPVGLDYAALPAVCEAEGVALGADLLARLRLVEGAAIVASIERMPRR
jgi:hypothetical protein